MVHILKAFVVLLFSSFGDALLCHQCSSTTSKKCSTSYPGALKPCSANNNQNCIVTRYYVPYADKNVEDNLGLFNTGKVDRRRYDSSSVEGQELTMTVRSCVNFLTDDGCIQGVSKNGTKVTVCKYHCQHDACNSVKRTFSDSRLLTVTTFALTYYFVIRCS